MESNCISPNQSLVIFGGKATKKFSEKIRVTLAVSGAKGRLGSGSFHSFLPSVPLAFPISSELLKEARYTEGNHLLIRSFIENRQPVTYYKLERCVLTFVHTQSH